MELTIQDGDYVLDGGGKLSTSTGSSEVLERILWKLTVHRGSFPFLPTLGSDLYLLGRETPSARQSAAQTYVAEALTDEDISITAVTLTGDSLEIQLLWQGEALSATLEVQL